MVSDEKAVVLFVGRSWDADKAFGVVKVVEIGFLGEGSLFGER